MTTFVRRNICHLLESGSQLGLSLYECERRDSEVIPCLCYVQKFKLTYIRNTHMVKVYSASLREKETKKKKEENIQKIKRQGYFLLVTSLWLDSPSIIEEKWSLF